MEQKRKYGMTFEEAQDYISKRGLDVLWNDCDIMIDERMITESVGNVLKYADDTFVEKATKYLEQKLLTYIMYYKKGTAVSTEEFIEEFKEAMKV